MNNRIFYTPKEKRQFQKKGKAYHMRTMIGTVICAVIVSGIFFGVRLRAFQVEKISINGLNTISEQDMQKEILSILAGSYATGLIPYQFLLTAPAKIVVERMKDKFPLIAEMEVNKQFPNGLTVAVQERQLFGVLCNDGMGEGSTAKKDSDIECFYLDTKGIAYQKAPETQGFLIIKISIESSEIPLGGQAVDITTMRRMIELNEKLPPIVGSSIISYQIPHTISHELRAVTMQGFSLLMKQDSDMDTLLYVLKRIFEKEIRSKRINLDYIDLRFGNKVFFKFK